MPSAAARRMYEDQIPSFMSIIDPESDNIDDVTVVDHKFMEMEPTCAPTQLSGSIPQHQFLRPLADPAHRHNESASAQNSESADSSPTTTLTTDTSSLSDPSPSSSPDSPVNLIPLNSFPANNFGELPSTMSSLQILGNSSNSLGMSAPSTLQRPMTSPSPRRPRNMKGLCIQPPSNASLKSAANGSEPASPSFIKPKIPGPKRKPSQLSLKTDSSDLNLRPTTLELPSTPSVPMLQRRALKHSTSSPHMLSGPKSAMFGPAGGMTFPTVLERGNSGLSEVLRPSRQGSTSSVHDDTIIEEDSPIRTQLASRAAMDFEPFHEPENNEDQKSPGYPDGPIAIYEDNIYLYLEPTAEEAAKFDVVINVAREVINPFEAARSRGSSVTPPSIEISPVESPVPDTAMTSDSFATAFEYPPRGLPGPGTPSTPKAGNWNEPEYIHMPWDHNTDIATDLMMLCETIEKRTKEGKKVLVHCQQGASRSASLIIAYGLYQNPGLSVNDAYYAAQSKSRWISPNMRLMYCLQDFQKEVSKRRLPPRSAVGPRRSPTKHRLTLSADCADMKPKEPLTAPLPDATEGSGKGPGRERSPSHSRVKSSPNLEAISPGPSSAPSSFLWSEMEKEDEKMTDRPDYSNSGPTLQPPTLLAPMPQSGQQSVFPPPSSSFFRPPPSPGFPPSGFPPMGFPPMGFPHGPQSFGFSSLDACSKMPPPTFSFDQPRETPSYNDDYSIAPEMPDVDALMSPRAETMTNNPLHESYTELSGMKFVEVPPTPTEGLFSPRETMFPRNPMYPFGRPTQVADPRSPPTKGETPITRSIDDVL
ncbi:hypothetical protein F4780DRAFT_555197 [Xylariomycetidae sp. FL0641]|nr:hypothetical protein F4780DRAFT_555197 [Xylariomycetidae sp. FL0641]